jgi:hypothetical protein
MLIEKKESKLKEMNKFHNYKTLLISYHFYI